MPLELQRPPGRLLGCGLLPPTLAWFSDAEWTARREFAVEPPLARLWSTWARRASGWAAGAGLPGARKSKARPNNMERNTGVRFDDEGELSALLDAPAPAPAQAAAAR